MLAPGHGSSGRPVLSKALGVAALGAFPANATGQLDVFGHDGDAFGVDGAQVGVFEQAHQIGFTGLLKSSNGSALETEIGFEILSDFANQALEWQFADEQLG